MQTETTTTTENTPPVESQTPPVENIDVETGATPGETVLSTDTPQVSTDAPPVESPKEGDPPKGESPPVSWLPEDLQGNERLKKFGSPEELARAYAEADLAQALPDTYKLPEGVPEQIGEFAKKNKFSQEQLDAMIALDSGRTQHFETVKKNVYDKGRSELFQSWGDKKDENLQTAEAVLRAVPSGAKVAQLLKATGEGANPVLIQFLHEVGGFLKEGGHIVGERVQTGKKDPLRDRYPTMFKDDE